MSGRGMVLAGWRAGRAVVFVGAALHWQHKQQQQQHLGCVCFCCNSVLCCMPVDSATAQLHNMLEDQGAKQLLCLSY